MPRQRATAVAHPNIALIKYWGKRDPVANLPAVGSLSVTLDALTTRTTVCFDADLTADRLVLNGQEAGMEQPRLRRCLDALRALAGVQFHATVESHNDFPTGAGLASSASGYAAIAVAGAAALGMDPRDARLEDVARIGSGSAPRSLAGGFVLLSNTAGGTRCERLLTPEAWPLRVLVAVTSEAGKAVSSRDGMADSRETSPFYAAWVETHAADLERARDLVIRRDFDALGELAEHNCLKMHAVMLATRPPLLYWEPATLACMQTVRGLRDGGIPVFFTVDAGPQLKAICLPEAEAHVRRELAAVPGVARVIAGGLGRGARVISADES